MFNRRIGFFSVLMLLALILSAVLPPSIASATGTLSPHEDASPGDTYQDIFVKYGIQPSESIPDGVVPFNVESPAELVLLMEMLTTPADLNADPTAPDAFQSKYCVATNWGTGQMRVNADFETVNHRVTRLYSVRTSLSGITLGFSLTSPWGYFTSGVPLTYVTWRGGGTLNAHILVSGLPVIYSQPYSCAGRYNVP